jgi:hypothetical protein
MRYFVFFFCLVAFGQIEAPRIGFWRDAQNRVRSLHGVAGSFVPGAVVREGVLGFAWYGDGGWLRTETEIERLDANGATVARLPAEEARFSETGVWLKAQNVALRWEDESLKTVAVDETEFAAPEEEAEAMAKEWWHVRLRGRSYAIRTTPGREARFEIPEADHDEGR